jgi:hypothetical protein
MMTQTRDRTAFEVDQTIGRIREINDQIIDSARRGGEASLQAYRTAAEDRGRCTGSGR